MKSTIAAVQLASGLNVKANLMEATRLIREAAKKGAQLVVLPECFALMAMHDSENIDLAEEQGKGFIQDAIKQCAIDNNVWIIAGTIPLKSSNPDKVSAASLMFNNHGELVARYNKIHLFDVDIVPSSTCTDSSKNEQYRESDTFEAGKNIVVVDTPFGKIGMSICYDLRFPYLYQEMVKQGAEIIVVPSAFTYTTGEMHWEPLLRARAIENQCYVIAAAQGGFHVNGRRTYGHSMAIDFLGKVQKRKVKGTGIAMMTVDLDAQSKTRESFPVLKHAKKI